MTVVKVGGSLFDWPELGSYISAFLQTVDVPMLVTGGGRAADAVRSQMLDEEPAHWLALAAMNSNAERLRQLLNSDIPIIDAVAFCRQDDGNADHLPHDWTVTSDAIAGRVAEVNRARELVLLKSCAAPGAKPEEWAAAGYVDEWLPRIVRRSSLTVRAINLRAYHQYHQ